MERQYFDEVYQVVRLIPKGRVTSYGAIAAYLGMRSGARLVGWAMNASHSLSDVPAHRVVNSKGLLTGKFHFKTPTTMQRKLEKEGIVIIEDQIQDFKKVFWDPSKELL
ncbi:MAG: MGMT family protein [Cytophagaceae bacterium]|jgi:methylated-DNA-protein-cysteine methyltransferase-like protein|nr:MGMT family protein [Cytophagaceae bacterium]